MNHESKSANLQTEDIDSSLDFRRVAGGLMAPDQCKPLSTPVEPGPDGLLSEKVQKAVLHRSSEKKGVQLPDLLASAERQPNGKWVFSLRKQGREVLSKSKPLKSGKLHQRQIDELEKACEYFEDRAKTAVQSKDEPLLNSFRLPNPRPESDFYRVYGYKRDLAVVWGISRVEVDSVPWREAIQAFRKRERSYGMHIVRRYVLPSLSAILLVMLSFMGWNLYEDYRDEQLRKKYAEDFQRADGLKIDAADFAERARKLLADAEKAIRARNDSEKSHIRLGRIPDLKMEGAQLSEDLEEKLGEHPVPDIKIIGDDAMSKIREGYGYLNTAAQRLLDLGLIGLDLKGLSNEALAKAVEAEEKAMEAESLSLGLEELVIWEEESEDAATAAKEAIESARKLIDTYSLDTEENRAKLLSVSPPIELDTHMSDLERAQAKIEYVQRVFQSDD